ncbi:hypothetical protein IAU60_003095 [Kwoniella sp. DSM 27419]
MPPKQAPIQPVKLSGAAAAVAAQQKSAAAGIADYELPKTTLVKLAKGSIPDNVKMQQDVVLALLRGSTLFINYLSAAAHDQALARSGKTITAGDVIKAVIDLDFGPADALFPVLEQELGAYRRIMTKAKLAKKPAGPGKGRGPRKSTGTVQAEGDVDMGEEGEEDDAEEGQGEGDDGEEPADDGVQGAGDDGVEPEEEA